jgi:HSP20 family molecular chaperone IbpA
LTNSISTTAFSNAGEEARRAKQEEEEEERLRTRIYNLAELVNLGYSLCGVIQYSSIQKKVCKPIGRDFIIPLVAILLIGIMFVVFARSQEGAGFIFLAVASGLMIYWVREVRLMTRSEERAMVKEMEQKNDWVYDLIKSNDEMLFVAEVPGPEEQINVRLINGLLHVKGGQNFAKDIPLELTKDMGISYYKYRNGVLTINIQRT